MEKVDWKKVDMEKGRQEKGCLFPQRLLFSTLENDRHGKKVAFFHTGKRLHFFTLEKGCLFPHWKMIDMEKVAWKKVDMEKG